VYAERDDQHKLAPRISTRRVLARQAETQIFHTETIFSFLYKTINFVRRSTVLSLPFQ